MNKIKLARIKRGVTQRELAEKLGVNRVTVVGYEKCKPQAKTLYKVAKALEIEVEELL